MSKKYTSLEHTIRQVHSKQLDEGIISDVFKGVSQWVSKNPKKSLAGAAVASEVLGSSDKQQPQTPGQQQTPTIPPTIQPVSVSTSSTEARQKSRRRKTNEETLDEMGIVGGKFKGIPDAFMEPNPVIRPKKSGEQQERTTQHAKFHSGKRKEAKMHTSSTMQGKVTEETDRKEIEYVSRPDTAKSPKDKKSKLGKQSAILTRIIDEEKTLLEFFNVTLKKKKEQKRKKVETESGESQVVFNPKLKTAIQEENLVSRAIRSYSKLSPSKKAATTIGTGTVGGAALSTVSPSKEPDNVEKNLGYTQAGAGIAGLASNLTSKLSGPLAKAARVIPGVQTATGLGLAGYKAYKGDYTGAALAAGSAIPGPVGWGFMGADFGRSMFSPDSPEEKKDDKPATGATPAPKPESIKSGATPAPAPTTPPSSTTPASKPAEPNKPEPEKNKIPNVGQKYDPISGKSFGGTDSQAKGVTNPLVPPSELSKPSDMGGYSDKQIVKSPSYSEPEKQPSVQTKPQPQSQPVQQPKPQPRQPQMSKPSQPEPKSDWASQELEKARQGRSAVFGQGGYESGGPSKIKAKDHVLKAFMRSKK